MIYLLLVTLFALVVAGGSFVLGRFVLGAKAKTSEPALTYDTCREP